MRRPWICVVALVTLGCTRRTPAFEERAEAAAPSVTRALAPSLDATAEPTRDFEDERAYLGADAGPGDPKRIAHAHGYDRYVNARFGFSLDVPRGLDALPAPTNGDGMVWRNGDLVVLAASGMMNVIDLAPPCARSKNVTAHKETTSTCWATGERDGYVFWERYAVANEVMYSLRFQYAESLKAEMDPIVTRVSASWKY